MSKRRTSPALILAMVALAGVLLWAKLRLVSNMPRSVYAEPKAKAVDPAPASGAATDTPAAARAH
ncbi:MAG: hypothetical protein IT435_09465 [Phycisphaerales bacterium]|nr:hypothetical protein [Phycisphaerales bacterium]